MTSSFSRITPPSCSEISAITGVGAGVSAGTGTAVCFGAHAVKSSSTNSRPMHFTVIRFFIQIILTYRKNFGSAL